MNKIREIERLLQEEYDIDMIQEEIEDVLTIIDSRLDITIDILVNYNDEIVVREPSNKFKHFSTVDQFNTYINSQLT